jgi:hypothetical protein
MDLVYVVDRSNSFVPETFDRVQDELTLLANSVALGFPETGAFRLGLITFVDGSPDKVEVRHELTTEVASVLATLNSLNTSAGLGGCPEASDEALREIVDDTICLAPGSPTFDTPFRAECIKHVVLVTDARPGGCDGTYNTSQNNDYDAVPPELVNDRENADHWAEAAAIGIKISAKSRTV